MALVTIRVLEGFERGEVFADLKTPVTIGREDENQIRLNDDRISRYHCKLQDDGARVILTDLGSTNGTRVNGHPVQLHVLRPGDLIMIGRCVLMFGDGPVPTAAEPRLTQPSSESPTRFHVMKDDSGLGDVDFAPSEAWDERPLPLFPQGLPEVPSDLPIGQRAQLSDYLAHLHEQIGLVLMNTVETEPADDKAERTTATPWSEWQRLLTLQIRLAEALQKLANIEPTGR